MNMLFGARIQGDCSFYLAEIYNSIYTLYDYAKSAWAVGIPDMAYAGGCVVTKR